MKNLKNFFLFNVFLYKYINLYKWGKCFILFCENKNSNKKNYKNQNIKFNNNNNK